MLLFGALCFVVLPGNKNGRASFAQKGNTGAPGDETNANGSARICNYCHFGAAGAEVFISLLDNNGDTVTQYLPGQQYTARVAINNVNPALTGFGFQMIALRDADNTDLDGFSDPGNNTVNNYKIATINSNGRTYAEHDNVSLTPVFDVVWTAPPAGTGPVSFYAAGNAVNRNGTTSGDAADNDTLKITEAPASAILEVADDPVQVSVWPNPVVESARVQVLARQAGTARLRIADLSGRMIWQRRLELEEGENMVTIPAADWLPGLYLLEVSEGISRTVVKILK